MLTLNERQKEALKVLTLDELAGLARTPLAELMELLGSPVITELARKLEPTPREVLEQVAALLEGLPVPAPELVLYGSGEGCERVRYDLVLEADGERKPYFYPADNTVIETARVQIGRLTVVASMPRRPATEAEMRADLERRATEIAARTPALRGAQDCAVHSTPPAPESPSAAAHLAAAE